MKVARVRDTEEMPEVFKVKPASKAPRNWLSFASILARAGGTSKKSKQPRSVHKLAKSRHKMVLASRRLNHGTKGRTQKQGK